MFVYDFSIITVIPNSKSLTSIFQDSYNSGRLSARMMHLLIQDPGVVAILRVLPEDYHIDERVRGFNDWQDENTNHKIKIYNGSRESDRMDLQALIAQIINENESLRGIFVSNALTYSVARYLESHPGKRKIHVIGYDLIKENVEYLKKGFIDFLISQQSERQGYQGIYMLFRCVVLKEDVPSRIMMPLDIITQENIDYYQRS